MKFPGGGGNMNKMMKQAKQMQEQIAQMQAELEEREIEASAGGGAVTVTVNGKQQLIGIKIKPEVVDPDDVEMLEDLITAAVNEGVKQSQDMVSSEMAKITGGLNLPGMP
ncbi:Nucleoid-associated protein YaaK [Candidatus Syntrophocurvum alkaliphilum]|uniref:Nucleoid-associated protein SYNTR_2003 n=1 Tax=Candidatus Syntrophocurvum alkaliphilum TaxID=2293317 RepID=A0A6I6DL43_9FIRM|nr:YbaB/EbfC family nucleoid-associated protein [Candidatus Syntrophocurvum alkaliphilum]QGU00597.1 Nucleoid-associated protein YaaK [Candidatus Syntrophocurvum alkaliphilum]